VYPDSISEPVSITSGAFFEQDRASLSRFTLAAYLLMAGVLFVARERDVEDVQALPPGDDLEALGISRDIPERVPTGALDLREYRDGRDPLPSSALAAAAAKANESRGWIDAARLVANACKSEDELIRVCALGSAVEFFGRETLDLAGHIAWFLRNAREPQTLELLAVLLGRYNPVASGARPVQPGLRPGATTQGLIAVHGTVLPFSQSNRPEWSVPPNGSLFSHVQSFRSDIYGASDYFRWEGGYTDYAREVAIMNLRDWLMARGMNGTDVVAHSHGCNVVMGSTALGANYTKIVLLSCPVHWTKYSLPASMITSDVISIRTKVDFVILMDRGGQRFPSGTIRDVVLPFWFTSHSATTTPKTWVSQGLDQYLA
jgi:hypothetical protein